MYRNVIVPSFLQRGIIHLDDIVLKVDPVKGGKPRGDSVLHSIKLVDSAKVQASRSQRSLFGSEPNPNIELALFFDAAAYDQYKDFFNSEDKKIRDMLLAYVNQMQVLYR